MENTLQEEDSKDEDSLHDDVLTQNQHNHTQITTYETQERQDPLQNTQESNIKNLYLKQYQTQNVSSIQNQRLFQNSRDKTVSTALGNNNVFSNSFDESAHSFDLKPQRNCKSSTRMMNKTQKQRGFKSNGMCPNFGIPLIHNLSTGAGGQNGALTAGSINKKQGAFNNFMKSKQMQSSYQQTILNQLQRQNTQNSMDMKNGTQDLSNRSMIQPPGGSNQISNSFVINQFYCNQNQSKPITPHSINTGAAIQQMILSGGQMNPRDSQGGLNHSTMDPYTYLRWKQQKYKSCRSIQAGTNQFQKQNTSFANMNNSNYMMQYKKGNQTQKTGANNKSVCSSNGSALGVSYAATPTTNMSAIKSLSEVKNPSMFISWRFSDRKLTELKDISQFKNLTDLDISGNLLNQEVVELKSLTFLKKLNLSNNQITEMYSLPVNLEILNISNNLLKKLKPEVTQTLKNLTTFDVSNNGLESLDGVQYLKRLKRLLSKNNQIIQLNHLEELTTIIEIDLENNPVDSYLEMLKCIQNKNDFLVFNLKLSPIMLTIQNYDQVVSQACSFIQSCDQHLIETFKKKFKYFNNGQLIRSKRVFYKIKTMQQHSKRSSSNFSNGSSSCGRTGVNTGGRYGVNNALNNTGANNNSSVNAFSPLLNNMIATPNQQYVSQRLEGDIEQLYDEILDEEEEIERKQLRIQKRKLRKESNYQGFDDDSADEDESLYEDEDFIHPTMSCEDDIDDLQSFRENRQNEFLNESTADFNKEIRQINQELRDELNNEIMNENTQENANHLQSMQSTQSITTIQNSKKNPISFKLDLRKVKQQQMDEDDFENINVIAAPNNDDLEEQDEQFDIPGLQFVKVTDDSFRQLQNQFSQKSLRNIKLSSENVVPSSIQQQQTKAESQESKKNTLRDYPIKTIQKNIIVPKLQLGNLQNNSISQSIPIKQLNCNLSAHKQIISAKQTVIKEEEKIKNPSQREITEQLCQNQQCMTTRDEFQKLKKEYEEEKLKNAEQLKGLQDILNELKLIFSCNEFKDLPILVRKQMVKTECCELESIQFKKINEELELKYQELIQWKEENIINQEKELNSKFKEKEETIKQLQEQLNQITQQNLTEIYNDKNPNPLIKEFQAVDYTDRNVEKEEIIKLENFNSRSRKKFICDQRKIKRPQSVVGSRKHNSSVKINSLLKNDIQNQTHAPHLSNVDDCQYINEYGTCQDHQKSSEITHFSQTMNKKVSHYIEKLKERNSSLQERLNGSFTSGQQNIPIKSSPINLNKINFNFNTNGDKLQISNTFIISPNNETNLNKNIEPLSATNQSGNTHHINLSNFSAHIVKQQQSKDLSYQRKNTNPDSLNSQNHNEYSERESANPKSSNHSKTQRIQIKKIQYNQFFQAKLQNNNNSFHRENEVQVPQTQHNIDQSKQKMQNYVDTSLFYPQKLSDRSQYTDQSFAILNNNINIEPSFRGDYQCNSSMGGYPGTGPNGSAAQSHQSSQSFNSKIVNNARFWPQQNQ